VMFGCLLEHLENLRHVKRCKTCNWAWMQYLGLRKLRKWLRTKCIHSTPLDWKWCLAAF
jgi:hypothetical protein